MLVHGGEHERRHLVLAGASSSHGPVLRFVRNAVCRDGAGLSRPAPMEVIMGGALCEQVSSGDDELFGK